ncbi:aspartic peptidase domain-containing protein [Mycena polygramma]|nr:aspartic peptidase domain-containing protein [Mycena polygramma]
MFPCLIAGLALLAAARAQQALYDFPHSGLALPLNRIRVSAANTPRLGQAVPSGITLTDVQEYTYVLQACFGSDMNCFNFVLDTGSSDLWVVCDKCQEQDCMAVPRFSPSSSSTLTETGLPFILNYLTGSVRGQIVLGPVWLGPYQVARQIFAIVSQVADLGLASTSTSGILGLCFPAAAAIPATAGATFLENLMSAFDDPSRCFFAFHLPRMGSSDRNGSFTIGYLDPLLAPDPTLIAYSSVVRTSGTCDYWKLPLLRLTVNGTPFSISISRVPGAATPICVLDTGTTLILGPTADVAALYALLGSKARKVDAGYQILCTHAVLLGFIIGDPPREYLLHPADVSWAEGATADGWCTGGIQANDNVNSGDWLLGDVFLRNCYVVHHTNPPGIGLLGLTDPDAAVEEFRTQRGPDVDGEDTDGNVVSAVADDGWDMATGYVKRWEQHPSGSAARVLGAVAGSTGFVIGGIGVLSWRFLRGV